MNPHSPEQQYPLTIVTMALGRCQQERENAEFLIETKQSFIDIIRQGYEVMTNLDEDIILPNGIILPCPRRVLDQDLQHHTAVIERQKELLKDILSAEATFENVIRRHKQSYDRKNYRQIIRKQQAYEKYKSLEHNLQQLENNLTNLKQDLERDITRLNQVCHQATSSSNIKSANSNDD